MPYVRPPKDKRKRLTNTQVKHLSEILNSEVDRWNEERATLEEEDPMDYDPRGWMGSDE